MSPQGFDADRWATCWPHASRGGMENRGKLSTREKGEQDAKLGQLHKLWEQTHLCRNPQQALAFGAQLALPEMATELGEQAYSKWAAKECFGEQWLHWHTIATGPPGCLPSNQPIESNHQVIQQLKQNDSAEGKH